jgi:hypothetical protein
MYYARRHPFVDGQSVTFCWLIRTLFNAVQLKSLIVVEWEEVRKGADYETEGIQGTLPWSHDIFPTQDQKWQR